MTPTRPNPACTSTGTWGAPVPVGDAAYRVEHRRGDAVAVLVHSDDPLARHMVLGPVEVRMLEAGASGISLLVEQETGDVVARRALHPAVVPRRVAGDGTEA